MPETRLLYLLQNYFQSKATPEENDELMSALMNADNDNEIKTIMDRVWEEHQAANPVFSDEKSKSILTGILKVHDLSNYKNIKGKRWLYAAAAAVILVIGSAIIYQLTAKRTVTKDDIVKTNIENKDIAPGGNKAVLTLANNSKIVLDNAANGALAQQGNTKILKLNDGQLAYNTSGKAADVLYNSISTPRGGQYQVVLPDGTKVWLNSASSLRFPTVFVGSERKVEITGEAYFEVAPSISPKGGGKQRFIVDIGGKGEVEVLGTHFNINAYSDESSINTTLLEGKVKVSATGSGLPTQDSRLITPGQQAQLNSNGQISLNSNPDIEEVMAWKNGKFQFGESSDITTIMRQIARWYDVDVEYKGTVSEHIGGTISRDVNVSKVFEMLEMTGSVKFQVNGKKVIVMPYKK